MPKPEDLLPLTPAVLTILLALADGDKHGYAIMQEAEKISRGQVSMGPGTVYGSIKRMLSMGLIVETEPRPGPGQDDARRRYYRLSDFGSRVLEAETRRLELLLAAMHRKLVTRGQEQ